ncbi:hypothetical protein CYMTET_40317 [Cymbomonas tetramitiformis]|uniref:Uncharacterized protein n=1 Tax=Cymbomonas tetramitiformis TaxID=36881 RepID=A0AAE0F3Q9_9CHLO|nr:hypothetical protein CYMTET_40317 [Cymbomonas tetramitiformis]
MVAYDISPISSESKTFAVSSTCRFEENFYEFYVYDPDYRGEFVRAHLYDHEQYLRGLGPSADSHLRTSLVSVLPGSVITLVVAEYRDLRSAKAVARRMAEDGARKLSKLASAVSSTASPPLATAAPASFATVPFAAKVPATTEPVSAAPTRFTARAPSATTAEPITTISAAALPPSPPPPPSPPTTASAVTPPPPPPSVRGGYPSHPGWYAMRRATCTETCAAVDARGKRPCTVRDTYTESDRFANDSVVNTFTELVMHDEKYAVRPLCSGSYSRNMCVNHNGKRFATNGSVTCQPNVTYWHMPVKNSTNHYCFNIDELPYYNISSVDCDGEVYADDAYRACFCGLSGFTYLGHGTCDDPVGGKKTTAAGTSYTDMTCGYLCANWFNCTAFDIVFTSQAGVCTVHHAHGIGATTSGFSPAENALGAACYRKDGLTPPPPRPPPPSPPKPPPPP